MRTQAQIKRAYRANYDQIASHHVENWRIDGRNPWQDPSALQENEDATVELILRYTEPCRWLDVGCGMGDLLMRLPEYDGHGVDLSIDYLAVALDRNLAVCPGDAEALPYPAGLFSLVTATDILEHVLDLNRVVKELLRVTVPGGYIVVRVPNDEPVAWTKQTYEFVHLRRFDEGTLRLLFGLIFGCEVLHCGARGNSLHLVAQK